MFEHINHVTLTTGRTRKTYPHEVSKELYFVLQRIVRESTRAGGVELFEGYRLKTTREGDVAIATVYADGDLPILTTAAAPTSNPTLWQLMHNTDQPLMTDPDKPVSGPFIADRLEIGAMQHADALEWTGDFSRCFGWIVLAPGQIANR